MFKDSLPLKGLITFAKLGELVSAQSNRKISRFVQDVTPKKGHYQDQQASGHAKPSSTLGYVQGRACTVMYCMLS